MVDPRLATLLERAVPDTPDGAHSYRIADDVGCTHVSHAGKGQLIETVCGRYHRPVVLDVGCGTGRYFMYVRRAQPRSLIGLDYSWHMLQEAQAAVEHARADLLVRGSLMTLGFRPGRFDVICCVGVFGEWCPLDPAFLEATRELLTPGGSLVLTTIAAAPPATHGWRGRVASIITPYLWGDLKRRLTVRLKLFTSTKKETEKLVTRYFSNVTVDSWRSETGRVDLHVVATAPR